MERTCKTCGKKWEQLTGRPAQYCIDHRIANHVRDREVAARTSRLAAADVIARAIPDETIDSKRNRVPKPTDAARFAVGLQCELGDDRQTAAYVGLGWMSDEQLAEVSAAARLHHQAIIERRTSATSELFQRFICLSLLRLIDEHAEMNPAQLALAIRASVQALSLYQGGAQAAYSQIVVTWPGKPGHEEAMTTQVH